MELRTLGGTDIRVSPVALGCWPISGMTSLGVTERDSLETIAACFDLGVNFLDTAYCYGADGESEKLIRRAIGPRRDEMVIATKGGIHWGPGGEMMRDGSGETLRRQCHDSLERLGTDRVDLYYLHAPDPGLPIAESAAAIKRLLDEGKVRAAGVSNCSVAQLREFAQVCPVTAVQPHYNMLQREIEADLLPVCRELHVAVNVYWPLLKGLLAGKLTRDYVFPDSDGRAKYPMFQGEEYQKNMDLVDRLREIAALSGHTVAQLVVHWTISQPGITSALCGAKRPDQIRETAGGMRMAMSNEQRELLDTALRERGQPVTRAAVT